MTPDYSITFACYNQIEFTRECVASLVATGIDLQRVVAVDNGSTDGSLDYLRSLGLGAVIANKSNLGCGVAWNQGALALQSRWTVVMNNDVVCAPGWLDGLLQAADLHDLHIVSPCLVEGAKNYDFAQFSADARKRMATTVRLSDAHAVCMAVRSDVWHTLGYFMPVPKLLGYEDAIFFHKARALGLRMGISGASWMHHYGMVTQKALKLEMHLQSNASLGNRKLLKSFMPQTWLARKLERHALARLRAKALGVELAAHGLSVHGIRKRDQFEWV